MLTPEQDKLIFRDVFEFYAKHKEPDEDITELQKDFDALSQKHKSDFVNFLIIGCLDEISRNYKEKYNKGMDIKIWKILSITIINSI